MFKASIKSILFLITLIAFSELGFSQLSKTHYIPPLTSAEIGNSNPEDQYFYISTPNKNDVKYTIKPVGLPTTSYINGTVSNNAPSEIYITTGYGQLYVPSPQTSTIHNNKGYIIEANDVIYVSVRLNAGSAAQAGALVSKGLAALGTEFRVGSYTNQNPQSNYLNFVSVMATEDATLVTFDDLPAGINIKNYVGSTPIVVTLDKGETYIVSTNSFDNVVNRDGLIGCLVTSDKNIVVNCGSANGSFHNGSGRDFGIDQIVGFSKVGNEYIFVKGNGENGWENVLIVAHENNTAIHINGSTTADATINAGEYYLIEGDKYSSNGNMYVKTSKNVFAYQGIGATNSEANQGMFFVPPLSCENRGNVDNIAKIDAIGATIYTGGVSIVAKQGSTVTINNLPISNFNAVGPNNVLGNSNYVTYKITGLAGNISIQSNDELYCAYFNYNGAATSGSFYSGFPSSPEINFDVDFETLGICIPNVKLSAANMNNFDSIEWYFNDGSGYLPTGNHNVNFTPTKSGNYKLIGSISCTNLTVESKEVPVSICPDDVDHDGIIDNLDVDNDNDGILNCTESFNNQHINLSNPSGGTIPVGGFSYSGIINTEGNVAAAPFTGTSDGTFMSELPSKTGINETNVSYKLNFNAPLNLLIEYANSSVSGNGLLTNDGDFIIEVPVNKTITVLNPDNQLLIDSNYDGIYESGITQFSSFQIRFRLNATSLPLGTGTFKFLSNQVDAVSYTHINNSETNSNQATFKISAICVPKDSDGDGIEDALDMDSDNDGIPDIIESTGTLITLSSIDIDINGLDDIFDFNAVPLDSDNDGIYDFYDLDSDNDGIYDLEESGGLGSYLSDTDINGIIDSPIVGLNGWADFAETSPDSGALAFTLSDIDGDLVFNYIDSDSDGDLCNDVIEAGFSDSNNDHFLGNAPPITNSSGIVINAGNGYTRPIHANYSLAAPITIVTQPTSQMACELNTAIFTIETNLPVNYQWQVSINGVGWTDINNNAVYTNATTNTLTISNIPLNYHHYKYRVVLSTNGNSCGLISNEAALTINPLPIITSPVVLKQCDNDIDGFSQFNLNEAASKISATAINETFTFYETLAEALSNGSPIPNPATFKNRTVSSDKVWASVESAFGCAQIAEIKLNVSTTAIPSSFQRTFNTCDDFLDSNGNNNAANNDRDGITTFDFSSVDTEVRNIFPAGQLLIIKYYRNEADGLAEVNEIQDITNYRNIGYPNSQQVYIRVDSQTDNDCLGFGAHITLNVEVLPIANDVTIERQCDDDQDGKYPFDVSFVESAVLKGQNLADVSVSYFDENKNPLPSPLPNPFLTHSQTITIRVTNKVSANFTEACFDETALEFTVDTLPIANPVNIAPVCDDDSNDGIHNFDTSTIQNTLLGSQLGMEVHYFNEFGNELPSPLPNPFTSSTQTITAQVINPINSSCIASTSFNLVVNPVPEFTVDSPIIICKTEPESVVTLNVYQDNPSELLTYEWTNDTGFLSNSKILEVSLSGTYSITLTKTDGTNCSKTKKIVVIESEIAQITPDDILIEENTDGTANITINNNLGIGNYEFSIDNSSPDFQDNPFFTHILAGIHTIYIRDKYCGTTSIAISIIGYPKFFTPNNDGQNDTWNVLGVNENFYQSSKVTIYDRFGKLITKIDLHSDGWNGLFNGQYLPSTDYWFSVELVDLKGNVRVKKGHFSLIRR